MNGESLISNWQSPLFLQATGRRREYAVRLARAGRVRAAGNRPGRLVLTAGALRAAVEGGLFNGRPMFIDHPGAADVPSLRNMAAVIVSASWNEVGQSADGVIRLYETPAGRLVESLLAEILGEGGPVPDVGLSMVFWPRLEEGNSGEEGGTRGNSRGEGVMRVVAIRHVESVDFVFEPAADGRVLKAMGVEKEGLTRRRGGHGGGEEEVEFVSYSHKGEHVMKDEGGRMKVEGERMKLEGGRMNVAEEGVQGWAERLEQFSVAAMLAQSGLPAATQARLGRGRYENPQQLEAAITEARAELAAVLENRVVQIGNQPPRSKGGLRAALANQGARITLTTPMDQAENAVNWLFGVPGAAAPEPMMRKADILYVALTGDGDFRGVFDASRLMFAAATTTTLANLAVNAMNRVVAAQFSHLSHWRWYERITFVAPNDGSLQPMQWVTFGGVGNLPTVAEGASYTELTVDDVRENDSFSKKGGYVGITREMIKNSDIQRIQAVPRALAIAAVRTRSAVIASIFTQNSGAGPALDQDSTALFHNNHSNLATTALGTDATAWRAARTECFKHVEVNSGKRLGVYPKYLLVPADLYDQSLAILGYGEGMPTTYTPEAQDRGFADPRAVPLVVPDWTDTNDWAYIVDPAVYPVIMMSYSQNPGGGFHPTPELFSVLSETGGLLFTNDTLPIKVRDEFAAGVNGYRGIGKRNVA